MCSERLSDLSKVLQLKIIPPQPGRSHRPHLSGLLLLPGGLAGIRNFRKRPWKQKAHPSPGRMCSVTGQTSEWEDLATARKILGGSEQVPIGELDGTGGAESHILPTCRNSCRPAGDGAKVGRAGDKGNGGPGSGRCPVTNCLTMGLASLGLSFPS